LLWLGITFPRIVPVNSLGNKYCFFTGGIHLYDPDFDVPGLYLYKSNQALFGGIFINADGDLVIKTDIGGKDIRLNASGGNVILENDNYFTVSKVAALPGAAVGYRRKIICVEGVSAGPPPAWTPDKLYVCLKDNLNAYNWEEIQFV